MSDKPSSSGPKHPSTSTQRTPERTIRNDAIEHANVVAGAARAPPLRRKQRHDQQLLVVGKFGTQDNAPAQGGIDSRHQPSVNEFVQPT
jgi:hypothetical protein